MDLVPFVKQIANRMTGLLKFSIDAWFTTVSEKENPKDGTIEKKYGLFYPNSWGSVNKTQFLHTPEHLAKMLEEITPEKFRKRLYENSLQRHAAFLESGVHLNRILLYQIIIDSVPPHFGFSSKT